MFDLSNNSPITVSELDGGYAIRHVGTGKCAYLKVNFALSRFDGRYIARDLGYFGVIDGLKLKLWDEDSSIAHEYLFAPDHQTQWSQEGSGA